MTTALEVFKPFLKLGVSSFGGPIAHLGYFRQEFVVAGAGSTSAPMPISWRCASSCRAPASSQIGFSIGLLRAGYPGRARGVDRLHAAVGAAAGAVRVRRRGARRPRGGRAAARPEAGRGRDRRAGASGVWRARCAPDRRRASIAVAAAGPHRRASAVAPGADRRDRAGRRWPGLRLCRIGAAHAPRGLERCRCRGASALVSLAAFALLLAAAAASGHGAALPGSRCSTRSIASGALVFGGGHVVLPLLREAFVAAGLGERRRIPGRLRRGAGACRGRCSPSPPISAPSCTLAARRGGRGIGDCSRSSCRACCCCRGAAVLGDAAHARRGAACMRASTPPWSGFSRRLCTIRSG